MKQALRLGIPCSVLIEWGGGVDLLRLFLSALGETHRQGHRIELLLFLPAIPKRESIFSRLRQAVFTRDRASGATRLKRMYWELGRPDQLRRDRNALLKSLRRAGVRFTVHDFRTGLELAELAVKCQVDVMAPSMVDLGADFPVPWVGYLPDVQHRHLGHLFDSDELRHRDASFAAILRNADAIVATSESVKRDLMDFFATPRPIVALPFAPPRPSRDRFDATATARKYGVAGRFFIVCNQFWKHKLHLTAFEALARWQEISGLRDVELVCTGSTEDYRDPSYFQSLMDRLDELNIRQQVHVLGRIPKADQLALVSGAIALIQPTLFEGTQGGLAVYDAVSLGVRCLVSDIAVNLEAQDELITFFQTGSPGDLALKMQDLLSTTGPQATIEARDAVAKTRLRSLGLALLDSFEIARRAPRMPSPVAAKGPAFPPLASMEPE